MSNMEPEKRKKRKKRKKKKEAGIKLYGHEE